MKEEDIRPQTIFDTFLELAKEDTLTYFGDCLRSVVSCVACGGQGCYEFEKFGFEYHRCQRCLTLFVSPRPALEAFEKYYRESSSVNYWAEVFYPKTAEARREKIWKKKAVMIENICKQKKLQTASIIEIGSGYGILGEELRKIITNNFIAIEPNSALGNSCRDKGLKVIPKFLDELVQDDLPTGPKFILSFELIEHLHNPRQFFKKLRSLMSSGDCFLFTTLSGFGVDIYSLGKHSKSVSPPHHLNFFNPKSITGLLEAVGFFDVEVTTPGELDIDLLRNGLIHLKDGFLRLLIENSDDNDLLEWQRLISDSGYSSHMQVTCMA